MLAHAQKHLLTVLVRQSPQQSPSVLLPLAALLLWVESLPHFTGLFVPARHAENVTNIGVDKS
jgi:hypothetical protein